ncbi:MAG: thioredoxin domain-containing protein, partial [Actinobacteria bacterium]|nr:thioredoxin domain-containing protein [Actinomycetota bacterium]
MVERTATAMARGGMYDQLGGGFARYAVDQAWVVPHFEKMLYDNALLLRAYLHWWRLDADPLAERVARETADFLLRDLRTPEGGFASALDADTDGVEGLTYVWTPAQLAEVLGPDADAAAALFEVTAAGTFEHGASTLQLLCDPDDPTRWAELRARLLAARRVRPQPPRDDKVVTAWNGLAVAALAEAGVLLAQPRYLAAAVEAAELLLDRHLVDGRLRRTSRDGVVGDAVGVAEDYGDLADGFLALHQATTEPRWLRAAGELLDTAVAHFADAAGGFFDTADDAEQLVRRPRDPADNATPSGGSALLNALVSYSALTGSTRHREVAEAALRSVAGAAVAQPRFFGWALAAGEALLAGPVQVAVVGEAG